MNKKKLMIISFMSLFLVGSLFAYTVIYENETAMSLSEARSNYLNSDNVSITPELMDYLIATSNAIAELEEKNNYGPQKTCHCNAGVVTNTITLPCEDTTCIIPSEKWNSADVNNDGEVNNVDYTIFNNDYGLDNCDLDNCYCDGTDMNMDGKVNLLDYTIFEREYGKLGLIIPDIN